MLTAITLSLSLMQIMPEFIVNSDPAKPINNIHAIKHMMAEHDCKSCSWLLVSRDNTPQRYQRMHDLSESLGERLTLIVRPAQTAEQQGLIEFYSVSSLSSFLASNQSQSSEFVLVGGRGYASADVRNYISARPHHITIDQMPLNKQIDEFAQSFGWSVQSNIKSEPVASVSLTVVTVSDQRQASRSELEPALKLLLEAHDVRSKITWNLESKLITIITEL